MRAENNFLMDRIDTQGDGLMRSRQSDWLPFPENFPARPWIHPGQQLDQGRFAGSVLSDKGMDLTRLKSEIDRLQRMCPAQPFIQLFEDEQRRGGRHRACCVV